MKVINVENKKQLKQFIDFPWEIYKNNKFWVPPLKIDVKEILSVKNPFWLHAKKQLFLACNDEEKILGRIAAIIDYNYISFQNDKCGFFGFFESVNDIAVAKALFDSLKCWLKEHGIHKVMGPMNPSTNDECGFLMDGFDILPSIMMPYTPGYYLDLAKGCGLEKIKELYAYDMDVTNDSRVARLEKVVNMAKKKMPMLQITTLKKSSFKKDLASAISIYNCAWGKNWGFVPWTNEEFLSIASKLKNLIDPEMIIIAKMSGVAIGMLISLPDYNQVLSKLDGKILPFGIFKFLYYRRKIDGLRLMVMGVLKEYRHKGIEAIMYEKGLKNALKLGYKHCELSWVLEDNVMTCRTAEMMNGKVYKKYAIYANFKS
ncbi:MAG: hypothetical protein LBJ79_01140 [Endomicrobium sp.]|jgi:hypothetical protein|nr:hypothetical protein [Endomicrobium sp.]